MLVTRTLTALLLSLALVGSTLALLPADAEAGPRADRRAAALKARLAKTRLSKVKFEDTSFKDVLKWLRTATGFNFAIRTKALSKADIDVDDITVRTELSDVSVAAFLKIVLEPHDLAVKVTDNVVLITTRVDALGKPYTRIYSIAHITWTKIDFIGPDINLPSVEGAITEEYEPEVVRDDDPLNSGDAVAELVQQFLMPDAWQENDSWSIRATDTYMIVRAPKVIHQQMAATIEKIASMK